MKPENFMRGRTNNRLYLIDFGLSQRFLKNGCHIPYAENISIVGNLDFSSISQHLGIQVSRRDDIEALAYILVYLLSGNLPWCDFQGDYYEISKKVLEAKISISSEELCRNLPKCINNL